MFLFFVDRGKDPGTREVRIIETPRSSIVYTPVSDRKIKSESSEDTPLPVHIQDECVYSFIECGFPDYKV